MDGNESKKAAIIRMLQIYLKHGSKTSPLRQTDFVRYLKEEYDIEIERKAVGRNIILLKEMGFDIRNAKQGTYLGGNDPSASVMSVLTGKEINVEPEKGTENESDERIFSSRYKAKPGKCELIVNKSFMDLIKVFFYNPVKYADYPEDKEKIRVITSDVKSGISWAKDHPDKVKLISPAEERKRITEYFVRASKMYTDDNTDDKRND